jgi:hypothetical protein
LLPPSILSSDILLADNTGLGGVSTSKAFVQDVCITGWLTGHLAASLVIMPIGKIGTLAAKQAISSSHLTTYTRIHFYNKLQMSELPIEILQSFTTSYEPPRGISRQRHYHHPPHLPLAG